jgi:hypothetical protein
VQKNEAAEPKNGCFTAFGSSITSFSLVPAGQGCRWTPSPPNPQHGARRHVYAAKTRLRHRTAGTAEPQGIRPGPRAPASRAPPAHPGLSRPPLTFGVLPPGREQEVLDFFNFPRLRSKKEQSKLRDRRFPGTVKSTGPSRLPPGKWQAGTVLTMATRRGPAPAENSPRREQPAERPRKTRPIAPPPPPAHPRCKPRVPRFHPAADCPGLTPLPAYCPGDSQPAARTEENGKDGTSASGPLNPPNGGKEIRCPPRVKKLAGVYPSMSAALPPSGMH